MSFTSYLFCLNMSPSFILTLTTSFNVSTLSTSPTPSGVFTIAPTCGNLFSFSSYTSCSYFKQHINLPQFPEIFVGFNERFCSFAIFIDTVSKSPKNEQQHNSRPQTPFPPILFTSSLTPICLSSILVLYVAAKSLTSSLKSTLPSDVNENNILLLSNLYSTSVKVMSNLYSLIFLLQYSNASFSFFFKSSACFKSLLDASLKTFFNGEFNFSSSIILPGIITSAISSPCVVSTIIYSPFWTSSHLGSKKYIFPNLLNLTPTIFFINYVLSIFEIDNLY